MKFTASVPARLDVSVDCDADLQPATQELRAALIMSIENLSADELHEMFSNAEFVDAVDETDCGNSAEDAYDQAEAER